MNKKMIFKILGIVGGVFVVLSLFLPYVKSGSFSQSLWQIYFDNKQIYLAIVIIIFGLLPVVLYAIDKKKEYSYMSVGALLFFVSSQLVNAISSGTFKTLSLGFYFMLVGTILITVITFISEKSSKIKKLEEQIAPISNNISNPLERNGLEISTNDNNNLSPVVEPLQNTELQDQSVIDDSMALGEEIPEYQPENGVNPVLAEFSTESTIQSAQDGENTSSSVSDSVEPVSGVASVQSLSLEEPDTQLQTMPESAKSELVLDIQPEVVSAAPQDSVPVVQEIAPLSQEVQSQSVPDVQTSPSIMPQPDISFDEPKQNEIPDSSEPQFDIFGQPK